MKKDKDEDPMVRVYTTNGQMNAQIVKGLLETEGIPVVLQYESAGLVYGLTVDAMGEVRIMVPKSCQEKAEELLEGLDV
jgi:hypothetical protein